MEASRPTILTIDLARGAAVERAPWRAETPALERVGAWGGAALAVALCHRERAARDAPFVIAVGDAVRRALPTAARACVAARSPLSGGYVDGHVGGMLGRALVAQADALLLRGRAAERSVLAIDAAGRVSLAPAPFAPDAGLGARLALLRARHPGAAIVACGPAGEARVPYASLANEAEPPSFTGRGGLGAALAAKGLVAIVVEHTEAPASHAGADGLARLLVSSPRLRARAAGGTLEQAASFAARGDPLADGLAPESARPANERKGCSGCPTPCGWVFERGGSVQGARFGAVAALGPALGLAGFDEPLALLARCDEHAFDAKEAGAAIALLCAAAESNAWAGTSARGDPQRIAAWIDAIPTRAGAGELLAQGSAALSERFGLAAPLVRRQAARADSDLAALLGQCISTRGPDPMRTFAFLSSDVPERARLERLLAPWTLPAGAEDPRSPLGKGRLVAWHESFLAAVDASGFCAFSAAALLADGIADLDGLCRAIAPATLRADLGEDGRALLAAGASIALVQRALAKAWGGRGEDDSPAFARAKVAEPGMLAEYRALRGLDDDGAPTENAWERLGTRGVLELAPGAGAQSGVGALSVSSQSVGLQDAAPRVAASRGTIRVRASGPLGAALGAPLAFERELPARLSDVLADLAQRRPRARAWLVHDGRTVPACWRAGQRLEPETELADGDELDLVVALSGG